MKKTSARDEIVACAKDPVYFINNYVKIRHPTRGLIPFKTFEYQDRTLRDFLKHRFNVVLKPRQMGFTELAAAFIVWLILFHSDVSVLTISTKAETAKNVIRRIRNTMRYLPSWLLIADAVADNKTSIELSNGSWVKSSSKSSDAGRSEALSLLLVDEAAHIEGFEDIWTAIKPTVSAGGRIIMLSTPNGVGNVFHTVFEQAQDKQNDFNPIRVDWWEHPEHIAELTTDPKTGRKTSTWFRRETKGFSRKQVAQEFECEFLASGDTFFDPEIVMSLPLMEPRWLEPPDNCLWIYHEPDPRRKYIVSADVATGDGNDDSAVHVFSVDDMVQAAEFIGKIPTDAYAGVICDLGERYNDAVLAIENNAVGLACIEHVKMRGYPNLYHSKKGKPTEGKVFPAGYPIGDNSYVAGVTTSGANRTLMLNRLEEVLRQKVSIFYSERFRDQLQTFIWNHGRPEARSGKTDDAVMAAAIGIWVREIIYGTHYNSPEMARSMLKAIKVDRKTNVNIEGASKNPDHVPLRTLGPVGRPQNPYLMRLPNGRHLDLGEIVGLPFAPRVKRG